MDFLGTNAPFMSDLNLVLFLIVTVLFIGSVVLARRKRIKNHGRIMILLTGATLLSLGVIMGPSFIRHIGLLIVAPLALGNLITEVHVVFGSVALVYSLRFINRMAHGRPCGRRREMLIAAGLWFIALFLGFGFYWFFFVLV